MPRKTLPILLLLVAMPLAAGTFRTSPVTTNNDDTCDIGLYPAATLLLPFFEVDITNPKGDTTIFTVTNTGPEPQAARVTLWTDRAYPVISFNLYLTGYDVVKVNLYDVIARGLIASEEMGLETSPLGRLSAADNRALREETCNSVVTSLPPQFVERMKSAFTLGRIPQLGSLEGCVNGGGAHANAIGYATVDVVAACTASLPIDRNYFTHEIRFDNVLMGDYVQVHADNKFAQASPMVHIRAIGEGGDLGSRKKTRLPRTFYSHLQQSEVNRTADARQPLPSVFAARWIQGSDVQFETFFKIWREAAATPPDATCRQYVDGAWMQFEAVRFDEDENPETFETCPTCGAPPYAPLMLLPATSLTSVADSAVFPDNPTDAVAGWMYVNLHDPRSTVATQGWVTSSMRSEGRFSVDADATALGNGCSAPVAAVESGGIIGPAPNGAGR